MIAIRRFDVCVIGGGPAGAACAIRLAQLGHRTLLINRQRRQHRHAGESLSPGVWTLLDLLGARQPIESGGFRELRRTLVDWEGQGAAEREITGEPGLLVDRPRFDAILRGVAAAHGVQLVCPTAIGEYRRNGCGWRLEINDGTTVIDIDAAILVSAGGRGAAMRGKRRATGPRTIALCANWRGNALPDEPQVEAGADAWYWGMPLPDGGYCTMVFVDPVTYRKDRRETIQATIARLIARSKLLSGSGDADLAGPVGAADATPFIVEAAGDRHSLGVGEATLAIDPLSSSGVQRAMQSGLTGAVVVNTLLRRPSDSDQALAFYRESLTAASERHRRWAAELYRAACAGRDGPFWRARATGAAPRSEPQARAVPHPELPVALGAEAAVAATPCIVGDYVELRRAVRLPGAADTVAFVAGQELAPLLDYLRPHMTAGDLVRSWSGRVAERSAIRLLDWMLATGVLVTPKSGDATEFRGKRDRGMPWQRRA